MRVASLRQSPPSTKLTGALQTALLLGLMMLLGALVGRLILGGAGLLLAIGFALIPLVLNSSASPRLAVSLFRARELRSFEAPGLLGLVNELSQRAELPYPPRLYLSPSARPNALTVGSLSEPIVIVTRGILSRLSGRQLSGVLAHEIAHIRHRDTWLLGLADSVRRFTRTLSLIGFFVLLINLPLAMLGQYSLPPGFLLMLIAAPGASLFLEMALSRTREYEADRAAVELTDDPEGFASALNALDGPRPSLWGWIIPRPEPVGSRLLRTHPPTSDRIRRIRQAFA